MLTAPLLENYPICSIDTTDLNVYDITASQKAIHRSIDIRDLGHPDG
jgi:hypothetical protein